jgi:hypothetical protein
LYVNGDGTNGNDVSIGSPSSSTYANNITAMGTNDLCLTSVSDKQIKLNCVGTGNVAVLSTNTTAMMTVFSGTMVPTTGYASVRIGADSNDYCAIGWDYAEKTGYIGAAYYDGTMHKAMIFGTSYYEASLPFRCSNLQNSDSSDLSIGATNNAHIVKFTTDVTMQTHTLKSDTFAGVTTANSGSIYGITVTSAKISSGAITVDTNLAMTSYTIGSSATLGFTSGITTSLASAFNFFVPSAGLYSHFNYGVSANNCMSIQFTSGTPIGYSLGMVVGGTYASYLTFQASKATVNCTSLEIGTLAFVSGATATEGSFWYDPMSHELKYYNGTGNMVITATAEATMMTSNSCQILKKENDMLKTGMKNLNKKIKAILEHWHLDIDKKTGKLISTIATDPNLDLTGSIFDMTK